MKILPCGRGRGSGKQNQWPRISEQLGPGAPAGLKTSVRLRRVPVLRPAGAPGLHFRLILGSFIFFPNPRPRPWQYLCHLIFGPSGGQVLAPELGGTTRGSSRWHYDLVPNITFRVPLSLEGRLEVIPHVSFITVSTPMSSRDHTPPQVGHGFLNLCFWRLSCTGGPRNSSQRWGASPPTFRTGFPGPRGNLDPKTKI